jgi:hypothetical protein
MPPFQVAEGTERTFSAKGTRVRISWVRRQPAFGSVLWLLVVLRAEPGDALWLTPGDGGRIDTQLASAHDVGVLAAIAHLTGADPAEDAGLLRERVAEAIGLSPGKSWDALAQALRGRGDADVAELIEEAFPATSMATPAKGRNFRGRDGRRVI